MIENFKTDKNIGKEKVWRDSFPKMDCFTGMIYQYPGVCRKFGALSNSGCATG